MGEKPIWPIFWALIGLLLFGLLGGCGTNPREQPSGGLEFEVIRQAADDYFSSGKAVNITAEELAGMMRYAMRMFVSFDPLPYYFYLGYAGPMIIDLRNPEPEMPDLYTLGHIPGAVRMPIRHILDWKYLSKLPKQGKVVVYGNTGQDSAQIAAILGFLGYDAVNLKWGMSSWTKDEEVAPGRYKKARDTVWSYSGSYRAVCPISEPIGKHPFPYVHNTDSKNPQDIIMAAAQAYLKSGETFDMSAPELNRLLYPVDTTTGISRPTGRWGAEDVPFFLDVRVDDTYLKGHLCGAQHIIYTDVFKKENLEKLPQDKQIMVYDETGHMGGMVTAALNLLGYDAINLKFGITGWSLALPGQDFAPDRFSNDLDCMDYPYVVGYDPSQPCPS